MRLGEILVAAGVISEADKERVLQEQRTQPKRLGRLLVEKGLAAEDDIAEAISKQLGLPRVHPRDYPVNQEVISLVPYSYARERAVLPLDKRDAILTLAMYDPSDIATSDYIAATSGLRVQAVVATETEVMDAIRHFYTLYGASTEAQSTVQESGVEIAASEGEGAADVDLLRETAGQPPVVRLINSLISSAVEKRATDIHIEPGRHEVGVRMRVDGLLQHAMSIHKGMQLPVAARVKIMSELDIAERRRSQDGRMFVSVGGRDFDIRVSIMNSQHGENIVLRLLEKIFSVTDVEQLGFHADDLALFRSLAARPQGMLLLTGPTGSGKTTTLYALLNMLKDETRCMCTVEEPIEYELPGIVQTQVHQRIGITFSSQLRTMLRQDPDVILVGEIRDLETADTAMNAALTGHVVLSTLHTNDAASSIVRLIDMGVQPYLIPSCISGVVAQRLIRLVCEACKEPYTPSPVVMRDISGLWGDEVEGITFYRGSGCKECSGMGYRGREAIGEFMRMTPQLAEATMQGASAGELKSIAISQGLVTLQRRGLEKVRAGRTTPEEVLRVALF